MTDSESSNKRTTPSVALVLGAGGARGLAHIGAIQILLERGYRIAGIAGSSMGALVGGIHAAGKLDDYAVWAKALERGDVLRLLDFTFGSPGLIRGERVIGALRDLVGEHAIESLPTRFVAVATDLRSQREIWLTQGSLFDAIRASIAIPAVFTPHTIGGREVVDGGLLAPVPITATRLFQADIVIAVDVNSAPLPPALRGLRPSVASPLLPQTEASAEQAGLHARIEQFLARLVERKPVVEQPGLMELVSRSLDAVHARISQMQLALDPPDVLVQVPRDSCFFYEFWRAEEMIAIGRSAAMKALDHYEALAK